MKFSEDVLSNLYYEIEVKGYEYVESSPFESDAKYEIGSFVFKDTKTGKHYQCYVQRTGSYFTDYEYFFDDDCEEVEYREVKVKKWMPAKSA